PVVRTRARCHADRARRQIGEEGQYLRTLKLLLQPRLAARVHAMHLEHVLCQINSNRRNLHSGRLLSCEWSSHNFHSGTSMPYREGGDHPIRSDAELGTAATYRRVTTGSPLSRG